MMTDVQVPAPRPTRGRPRSGRTDEQTKERHHEQMRRYGAAQGQALTELKRRHQAEYWEIFDPLLKAIYEERGPLPWEQTTD